MPHDNELEHSGPICAVPSGTASKILELTLGSRDFPSAALAAGALVPWVRRASVHMESMGLFAGSSGLSLNAPGTIVVKLFIVNCRFSTETFWRLVFSHKWFIIHLQRDEVELEMNSEPRV